MTAPARLYIACGGSVALIVAAFFYVGGYQELRYRLRRRRRRGYLIGGDR